VPWGNPRLSALRKCLYLAPGIICTRGVTRKTGKCDTVPFPGSGDVAARTVRCVPMGEVSAGMIVLYPGSIGDTRQQGNFLRVRVRKVDRAGPVRFPRGPRGPGYEVAREVPWGNPRLRALREEIPIPGPFYTTFGR